MSDGYVLDFNDERFEQFFDRYGIDIHSARYQVHGTSKAKKMRVFWEKEPDTLVGSVLSEMLDAYEALCDVGDRERDLGSLKKSRESVAKLSGQLPEGDSIVDERFVDREFDLPSLQKLPVDLAVSEIIHDRLKEAQVCLSVGAHLSVIFQCGSVLEAVLLGAAQKEPENFNRSTVSPKRQGKVKPFHEWSLADLINAAHDIGLLKPDVQKFSHALRDFRNYIHPYEQKVSGF